MPLISENQKSYSKLAQIYNALRNDFTFQNIKKIISKEGKINCKIPSRSFINSSEPALAGSTALHIALSHHNNQVVELLLHVGLDYTIKNNDGLTALHYIATSDFHSLSNVQKLQIGPFIDAILSAHVISKNIINPCNNDGLSHLHIACMVNHTDVVKLFLKNGEDVNQTVNTNSSCNPGYTPLHFAVKCCATETVKILLDHGANIFLSDSKGMGPLHVLLERKIHIYDSIDMEEFSSTVHEDIKVNEDIMNLLLEKTSRDKLIIDDAGLSRFHIACTSQDTSIVESILENVDNFDHSISVNSRMWPGYTGLHFAAHCNVNTVRMLLTRGANLEVEDARGVSPFDICLGRYRLKDICSIVSQKQEWKDILFSDGEIRLFDLLFAMENLNRLKSLLQSSLMYVNAYIPKSSKLWPGYTPLHLAITLSERQKKNMSGDYLAEPDLDLVREFLADGADVTIRDSRGCTPLNLAYRQNKMRIVNLLFHCHHVLVNPTDEDNLSHLHIACEVQNEILVEKLLLRTDDANIIYKGNVPVKSIKPGYTPLHIAVAKKNLRITEILMRYGADINIADFNGCTPIHETLHLCDNKSIAKILFSSSTLRECIVDGVELSHLHIASENNEIDVVKRLLQLGAEIDRIIISDKLADNSRLPDCYKGCTALHLAVMCHAMDVIIFLLERGADILAKIDDGPTPLFTALGDENKTCFYYFIPILKCDEDLQIRMEKETGMTMLHIACYLIDVDEVKNLLGNEANVNGQINGDSLIWAGCTPLHVLSFKELECSSNKESHAIILAISKILIDAGANVTLTNAEGETPIHICSKLDYDHARYSRVGNLMNYHADFNVNPVSAKGLSHFHLACMVQDIRAVEKFLKCGADVNEPIDFFSDKYPGCSSIYMAIDRRSSILFGFANQLEIINLLLKYGVDVNAENSHGYTALHNAARAAPAVRKQILETILSAGANINSISIYGETPFEILLLTKEIAAEEIRFFVECNAHINSCNPNNDKGYLSMLLSKIHHTNQQTAAFEEMMKAPDIVKVNDMGRTAIHNVVTTAKPNISTEGYIQLIIRLMKLGCDVDSQDKSGWTTLHLAGQFGNKEATVALLTSGADVNIIDTFNKSAFSYAIEICRKCDKTPTHRHNEVIQALALHLHKLQLLDLDVSQLNANLKKTIWPRIDVEEKFHEEVDIVKNLKITETSLVVVDFLSETKAVIDYPYMNLRDRNAIDGFFKTIDNHGIVQLKGILMLQYRKAVSRLRLIEFSITALRSLLDFPLPELCCEIILKFLRNEDLKNLIASAKDDT